LSFRLISVRSLPLQHSRVNDCWLWYRNLRAVRVVAARLIKAHPVRRGGDFNRVISVNFLRDGAVKNREHSRQQTSSYDTHGQILNEREPEGSDQY
jgi:hypothetical protein